jgi:hypothetical protein
MKYKAFAIFQLVILVFYLLRPIMPYIEYALNKDFIAKNLCVNKEKPKNCCQGKCHLAKEVKKNLESNDDKEKNSNKKIQNEEVKEFLSVNTTIPVIYSKNLTTPIQSETTVFQKFVDSVFIPPQEKFVL